MFECCVWSSHQLHLQKESYSTKPPYYSTEFFGAIRAVRDEGLFRMSSMTIGVGCKALLERYVTHEVDDNGFQFETPTRTERSNPDINWIYVWSLSKHPCLDSVDSSFLFCLLHNLLPTQERPHRVFSRTKYLQLCLHPLHPRSSF